MVEATKLSDRYSLTERLAIGGMGSVYLAQDERLGRRVAIKLLKDELAGDPRFVERFRREARAVASLSHPNMVAVYDYGEDENHHYIVMEYAEGRDLAQVLREEGPFSPDRAVHIGSQICAALGHAHAAGVIHRDVKPANIILSEHDRARVTDFGIARAAGDSTLTATGSFLGTAHYLSPEQASSNPIGPASDIYSLGIVLYEMLTGAVPFTGDTPIAVAMRHVSDPVPPPSELNPDVPPELDEVIATATAKDPEDRFASAEDMAAALQAASRDTATVVLGGATATATADTPTREMDDRPSVWPIPGDRWEPAKVGRWALVIFVVLLLVAAFALASALVSDDEPTADRAGQTQQRDEGGSDEPERVVLQDHTGEPYEAAKENLEAQGYKIQKEDQDSAEPKDIVIGSDPEPGTALEPGQEITLIVSNGALIEDVEEDDDGGNEGEGGGNEGEGGGPSEEPPGKEKKEKEEKD
jgi:predicted Ser/Thr protein kinase